MLYIRTIDACVHRTVLLFRTAPSIPASTIAIDFSGFPTTAAPHSSSTAVATVPQSSTAVPSVGFLNLLSPLAWLLLSQETPSPYAHLIMEDHAKLLGLATCYLQNYGIPGGEGAIININQREEMAAQRKAIDDAMGLNGFNGHGHHGRWNGNAAAVATAAAAAEASRHSRGMSGGGGGGGMFAGGYGAGSRPR